MKETMASDDDMITLPNGSKFKNPKKCGNCGATENLKKCKCLAEAYCSRGAKKYLYTSLLCHINLLIYALICYLTISECQVENWTSHQITCKLLCKLNKADSGMEALRAIMQLQLKGKQPNSDQCLDVHSCWTCIYQRY